jgi:parallel beta-helix repeat protein
MRRWWPPCLPRPAPPVQVAAHIRNEGAQRVRFVGNVVEGNADGVRLENAAEVVMTGNKVTDNEGFALKADKGTTGYTITGNDFSGNGDGVELASPDGVYQDNVEGPGGTGAAAP